MPEAWPQWLAAAGLGEAVPAHQSMGGPQYDLLSMACGAAIAGVGIALLPHYVAGAPEAAGQIVRLSPVEWTAGRAYHLRHPEWKADLPALRTFRQWLALQTADGSPPRSAGSRR